MVLDKKILIGVMITLLIGTISGIQFARKWCPTMVEVPGKAPDPVKVTEYIEPKGTLIGKGCTIDGKLTVDVVAINGKVIGEINTKEATVNGIVEGPITAEMVIVEPSANIRGDITSKGFEFKNGASYAGNLTVGPQSQEKKSTTKTTKDKDTKDKDTIRRKLENILGNNVNTLEEIELPAPKIEHIKTKPFDQIEEIHIHVEDRRVTEREAPITSSNARSESKGPERLSTSNQQSRPTINERSSQSSSQPNNTISQSPKAQPTSSRVLISASDLVDLSWQVVKDTPEYKAQLKSALNWDVGDGSRENNLYAKLVSASGTAKSGKIEDLKKFFYVLALHKDLDCAPPSVVTELVQKNKKEFDELCSNWSWENAASAVQKLMK